MQLSEFTRSPALRWTLLAAGIFAALIIAILGSIYLNTKYDLTTRSDRMMRLANERHGVLVARADFGGYR